MSGRQSTQLCDHCGAGSAHRYQHIRFGEPGEEREIVLCVRCARQERMRLRAEPVVTDGLVNSDGLNGLTRQELIAELDRFFAAAGVFDICGRCHRQGTGCCPPDCRVMGAAGCDPNNRRGKTVFCAAFVCGALLNAIAECDAATGRELKRIKNEFGPAEYHIYEMIARVPAEAREPVRPLALPVRYPRPAALDGETIRPKLLELAEEVLSLRRQWHELDKLKGNQQQ
jgi:hypothetical protein